MADGCGLRDILRTDVRGRDFPRLGAGKAEGEGFCQKSFHNKQLETRIVWPAPSIDATGQEKIVEMLRARSVESVSLGLHAWPR